MIRRIFTLNLSIPSRVASEKLARMTDRQTDKERNREREERVRDTDKQTEKIRFFMNSNFFYCVLGGYL